jgi:hypothetical protein
MDSATPFMLEAKREYLTRLCDDIAPFLLKDLRALYDAVRAKDANKALLNFQSELRAIPKWNAGIIREKTEIIEARCPWLSNLIAAVFVSFIKVMSSVRVSQQERPNIRLKLPTNDAFVHQVYVETARALYEVPDRIRQGDSASRVAIVQAAIETTVRDQLPLQDILQAYLGKSVDDEGTMAPVLSPVHSDDDEPGPAADDSGFARAAEVYSESSSDEEEEEEEPKVIPVPPAPGQYQPAPAPFQPSPPLPPPPPYSPVPHPPPPHHLPVPSQIPPAAPRPRPVFDDAEDGHL